MKIAAACYPIDWIEGFDCYAEKMARWVADAAGEGADLLVFPEYGAMELAATEGREAAGGMESAMRAVDALWPQVNALCSELAAHHNVHILGGSGPCYSGPRPVNRAHFHTPGGSVVPHDKQILTPFERAEMDMRPGAPLKVMETDLGGIGVLICYDAEFPLLGRALAEAGADILLVPSATEAVSGFHRVRVGAMARALENQCVAVHAPTQGRAPWNPVVDENAGTASVYGPPDLGFPDTGILAQGDINAPGWTYAEVSPDAIAAVRRDGRVQTRAHWPEQAGPAKSVTSRRVR